MPKFKRGKSLIISLLCIMIALTTLFSVVKIVYKNPENINEAQAASGSYTFNVYVFTEYDETDEDSVQDSYYKNNSEFHINSAAGLYTFSDCVASGYSFEGKVVYLDCDIDWTDFYTDTIEMYKQIYNAYKNDPKASSKYPEHGLLSWTYQDRATKFEGFQALYDSGYGGVYWQPIGERFVGAEDEVWSYGASYSEPAPVEFKGAFDGQFHSIKNLNVTMNNSLSGSGDEVGLGLFGRVNNAAIQNLRIENLYAKNYNTDTLNTLASAVVGISNGDLSIDNCIVEGVELNVADDAHGSYFGAIVCGVAGANVSINNCYIKDVTVDYGANSKGYATTVGPSFGVGNLYGFSEIVFIFNHFDLEDIRELIKDLQQRLVISYNGVIAPQSKLPLVMYHPVFPDEEIIDDSNIKTDLEEARDAVEYNDAWYMPKLKHNYNNNWPYLSNFIKFNVYKIQADKKGSISGSTEMRVPDGYDVKMPNSSNFTEWDCEATAIADEGYDFLCWTKGTKTITENGKTVTVYTCTAEFENETYYICFGEVGSTLGTCTPITDKVEVKYKYHISFNCSIYEEQGDKAYKISAVVTDEEDENPIEYELYIVPFIDFVEEIKVNNSTVSNFTLQVENWGDTGKEVGSSITLKLKSYDVVN